MQTHQTIVNQSLKALVNQNVVASFIDINALNELFEETNNHHYYMGGGGGRGFGGGGGGSTKCCASGTCDIRPF